MMYQTAFIVYIDLDGEVAATADLTQAFDTERDATIGDMRRTMTDLLYILDKAQVYLPSVEPVSRVAQALAKRESLEH